MGRYPRGRQGFPLADLQYEFGVNQALQDAGDDVWLLDPGDRIIDYVAYGSGGNINLPPPGALGLWDDTYQSSLDGAGNGDSIALTSNGVDGNHSACWEESATGAAGARPECAGEPVTIDSDPVGGRDTSVGSTNTLSLNDPPTAVDDGPFSVEEDGSVILIALPQWLINDSDPDGDPLGVSGFDATTALGGTVTLLGGGAYRYDPPPDYAGDDTFTYTITDGQGNFATATITLVVMDVNDDPSFTAGSDVSLPEDAGAYSTGWAAAISAGPASESGQTVMFSVVGNSNPGLFAVLPAIAADGTLSFTALADTSGIASIDVELSDDGGTANGGDDTSPVALFTITVNPVNDEPSFIPAGDVSVLEGSAAYSGTWATAPSAGAADESGQILTFTVVGNSNPGLFAVLPAVTPGGTLTFTPAAATTGSATIDVELSDDGGTGNGGDDTAPVVSFQVDVAQGGLYYLRETGSGADYDLSVVAPPPGPIADYEGDDDPGLTIDKSGGGVNEPDPDKY